MWRVQRLHPRALQLSLSNTHSATLLVGLAGLLMLQQDDHRCRDSGSSACSQPIVGGYGQFRQHRFVSERNFGSLSTGTAKWNALDTDKVLHCLAGAVGLEEHTSTRTSTRGTESALEQLNWNL